MIDVHCHLADNKFKDDVAIVVQNAIEAGVSRIVSVPEFPSQFDKVLELSNQFPGKVHSGIGVHPIQKRNKGVQLKHLADVESYISRFQEKIVCIGEIGLDHTISQFKLSADDLKVQEEVFRLQIQIAKHFDLPVNVHSRSAARRTIEVLRCEGLEKDKVVLHAFDGSVDEALEGVQAGFLFSVPPSFSNSERALQVIDAIPLEQLLLETDAPALGPAKGVRNEPANLRISAGTISKIKKLSIEDVIEATTKNAERVFKFK